MTAHLSRLRMSPRKVRLVADVIRGLDVAEADAQLRHVSKAAARPVRKLVASAAANAVHNFGLDRGNLFIRTILVNQGPTLKRFRPRAFGRAAVIRKRMSHVTIVLDEHVPTPDGSKKRVRDAVPVMPSATVVADRAAALQAGAADRGGGELRTRDREKQWQEDAGGGTKRRSGFFRRFLNRRTGER